MPADPETLTKLTEIATLLGVEMDRAKEDRKAGADARDKIDAIHTQTQTGFTQVRSDIKEVTARLDDHMIDDKTTFDVHGKAISKVAEKAHSNELNVAKVVGASAGGGGLLAFAMHKFVEFFMSGSGPHQ